jgi:hypothetical protein
MYSTNFVRKKNLLIGVKAENNSPTKRFLDALLLPMQPVKLPWSHNCFMPSLMEVMR